MNRKVFIILVVAFSGALLVNFYQGVVPAETKSDNAAVYYEEAIGFLIYPSEKDFQQRAEYVIRNGWYQPDESLYNFVRNNKLCLKSIEKAKSLSKCDFSYKKQFKYLADRDEPPGMKLLRLQELVLLNARYYESQGNIARAIDYCLTALELSSHVSQDESTLGKILSLVLERKAFPVLRSCLLKVGDEATLTKISRYIRIYKKKHFPARALVEEDKKFFLSSIRKLADSIIEESKKGGGGTEEKQVEEAAHAFIQQADKMADEYFGYFEKAVVTSKDEDWRKASEEYQSLKKTARTDVPFAMKGISKVLVNTITGRTRENEEMVFKKILATLMVVTLADFKRVAELYHSTVDELNALSAFADAKMGGK